MQAATILNYLDQFAPRFLAEEWDNVGLLLGERSAKVSRVLTCLTITPEVVAEAIDSGATLIVTHHPVLFRGAKRLTGDQPEGRMLLDLIRAGVAVYSPHTAFDNTPGGINDLLAQRLELTEVQPLRAAGTADQAKVVVFVPEEDLPAVSREMFRAGAGKIGDYRECSFRISGTGTFYGTETTNPSKGERGKREEVAELRLEVICPKRRVDAVLNAISKAHSYEEPAFDVYPLTRTSGRVQGAGRMGKLKPQSLSDLVATVKTALACGPVQVIGDPDSTVESVAIVCGAGGEMLSDAIRARADVFLTGEMRFHDYLRAQAEGVALCLPGHYATERFALEVLAEQIATEFPELTVEPSHAETDPVTWL